MSARNTALNALIACRKEKAWSNGILKEYVKRDRLDRRDAALAARLCYGVLQNRMKLDFYLGQLLTGKVKNLHPVVRDVFHMGLYQLYEMDKIPESAIVNESVDLVKRYCPKQKNAAGLVNAVLRKAVATKGSLAEPRSYVDRYSHPQALVDLLKDYVGKDRLEGMLQANNAIAPTVIQTNTLQTTTAKLAAELTQQDIKWERHPWMEDCLILSGTGDLEKLPAFREGKFYVQDCAAKLSVLCAQIPENSNVLDCCAAPGGKTFAAAMAMNGTGTITSCDIHEHKRSLIESGAERLKLTNVTALVQDASQPVDTWQGTMDVVIADVPCSGYGIIRKKPDIRYKDPKTMTDLPQLQLAILKNQAKYVKKGCLLIYSTCTLVRAENEGVVEAFLKENPEFTTEPLPLPAIFPKNESGMLALIPGEYETDGFFICRLRRTV